MDRTRRSRSGTSGDSARSSTMTNATRRAIPTTADPTAIGESHPAVGASTRANTIAIVPAVTRKAPGRSNRPPDRRACPGRNRRASATRTMAIGTFTKKTARQVNNPVRTPPARTPRARPLAPAEPQTEIARVRSGPSVKVESTSASVAGNRNAPAVPWSARLAMRSTGSTASPPAVDAIPNTTSAPTHTRRAPSRSAVRPPRSRKPP